MKRSAAPGWHPVLDTIISAKERGTHVELAYMLIPGQTDQTENVQKLVDFVKDVDPEMPMFFLRFFPSYKMSQIPMTLEEDLNDARDAALSSGLRYAYVGNTYTNKGVEIPSSHLAGDKNKITTIRMENLPVYVLGLEDLIMDRIMACVYWTSHTDCEQARFLLRQYQNRLDFEYLEKKAREDGQLRVLRRLSTSKPVWKLTARGQKL